MSQAMITLLHKLFNRGSKFKQKNYIIPAFDCLAYSGFANQPANDDVQVISNNAGDTGKITLFGIDNADNFQFDTITLNGTTAVDSVLDPKWKTIYGAFMGDIYGQNYKAAIGTITIREKSAGAAITTIAATKLSTGMVVFDLTGKDCTVNVLSGSAWVDAESLASVASAFKLTGSIDLNIAENLYLISDATGASVQIIVWED